FQLAVQPENETFERGPFQLETEILDRLREHLVDFGRGFLEIVHACSPASHDSTLCLRSDPVKSLVCKRLDGLRARSSGEPSARSTRFPATARVQCGESNAPAGTRTRVRGSVPGGLQKPKLVLAKDPEHQRYPVCLAWMSGSWGQ